MTDASPSAENSRFLRACRGEPVDATPIWLMRQAGRYMPAYRGLRERWGMLELIEQPELACQVTMQPVDAFNVDAAIIFADILPLLAAMGMQLAFVAGEGPVLHDPLRSVGDLGRLRRVEPETDLGFTLRAIELAQERLRPRGIPLIGFSGAPFTLACYAIEGGSSKTHARTKAMMMGEPDAWGALMGTLAEAAGAYLLAQARAGADALQLFDSWAGELSPADYAAYVLPATRRTIEIARQGGVPVILFGVNTNALLELQRDAGADVIGIDWRTDLGNARRRLGPRTPVQGNLDPVALLAPWPALKSRAQQVIDANAGARGHIFNLGHGVLPETPVENVARLVDFVHAATAK